MTMHPPTTEQIREGWDAVADGFDEYVTPLNISYGDDALDRVGLREGMRFLEVAAGTGSLAIPAARRGARVLATDLSPRMVRRLVERARAEGVVDVDVRVMDGCDLAFADDTFDVAASQNGVSLFPDLKRGLAELVRVTKTGGRAMIVTFGPPEKAEFLTFFLAAVKAVVPGFTGLPADPPPLPFQVADADVLRQRLAEAGLTDVRVETTAWDMPFRSGAHFWKTMLASNPIAGSLTAGLTAEQTTEATQTLDGMLRERSGGGPGATLTSEMNIGIGTK